MKRIALALIACAGCGFLAGRTQPEPDGVPDNPKPTVAAPETDETPAIQTPLVAKLLPGGGVKEAPSKAAPPAFVGPYDGDLSPGGNFRYSAARNLWVPVDKGNRRYTHGGQSVGAAHLIEHGHHHSAVAKWTQAEREIAHANDHAILGAVRQVAPPRYTSSCPNGQ
jgi:hypothetical protein